MIHQMKEVAKWFYRFIAFTGSWIMPVIYLIIPGIAPAVTGRQLFVMNSALIGWILLNNLWALFCEGKTFGEFHIGDGLVPDSSLRKESAERQKAMYPRVPKDLLSKNPEGVVLGTYREHYVRIPWSQIYHYCIIGGSGSGKTSTVLLDTLLSNFATGKRDFVVFAIDIKGELNQKSVRAYDEDVLVVDPSDRTSYGWDAYYRLHGSPSDDLIIEAIEEIAQALIISTNPRDNFFVENARSLLVGLLIYYYRQDETFIDGVNKILEADIKSLLVEIIKDSEASDLWYKYLAKFAGKDAESVEDCMVEMTTSLSVFSKSDIRFCFRDNFQKASPYSFKEDKSVFLAIPEHLLESYKAIMRLCTVQTLKELERRSEQASKPMLVVIDEFARIGRMEGIFNALATLRSKAVMVMLAFQSLAQCEAIYSKEETRVLVDNCRVKIICEASDPETARTVIGWAGKYREKRETISSGRNRHKSYSYEDRDILTVNDLVTLTQKEEVILIVSGTGYLRTKKCFYFKDKKLRVLAETVSSYNKNICGGNGT